MQQGLVSPLEAYMKAIDKNRFRMFLPPDEAGLANSAGSAPDDEQRPLGDFVKAKRAQGLTRVQASVAMRCSASHACEPVRSEPA